MGFSVSHQEMREPGVGKTPYWDGLCECFRMNQVRSGEKEQQRFPVGSIEESTVAPGYARARSTRMQGIRIDGQGQWDQV